MQTLSRRGRVSDGGQMTFPFLKVTKFPNDVLFFHRISLHRLGSGGLPCCGSGLIGYSFWKLLTTSDRVLGSAVGKGLCGPLWLLHLFGMNGGGS